MSKLSVLIPFKPDNGRRDLNMEYVRQRYQKLMPELELVICLDYSEPFCKGKAVNEAAKKATGEIFIVVDADVIFEPELIRKIDLYMHVHHWLQPFKVCYLLSQTASDQVMEQGPAAKITFGPNQAEAAEIVEAGPLMNVMTRECFEAVGGFDERFKGWGWEDIAFSRSLDTICGNHFRMDETIYHLWHPSSAKLNSPEYQNNCALFRYYYQAGLNGPEAMKKLIRERSQ
ncbi:MAG: glycosyltransferase family 2 protein [Bacillota bacterium]